MTSGPLSIAIQKAASSLARACSERQLEELAHELDVYLPFQDSLIDKEGESRKQRLALIIAASQGFGFLANNQIRKYLSSSNGLKFTTSWSPGSTKAYALCDALKLPTLFGGVHSFTQKAPVISVDSMPTPIYPLQFQEELISSAIREVRSRQSSLISIPTGGGKTIVASQVISELAQAHDIAVFNWIAHTEELCEQAISSIVASWRTTQNLPSLTIFRVWGRYSSKALSISATTLEPIDSNSEVILICSTPQSFSGLLSSLEKQSGVKKALSSESLTIIDEAHRAGAPTYIDITRRLAKLSTGTESLLLGLSATPIRESFSQHAAYHSGILKKVFKTLIEPSETIKNRSYTSYLRELGVLATPVFFQSKSSSFRERTDYIVDHLRTRSERGVSLVFCSSTQESDALAAKLNIAGLSSVSVTAKTQTQERQMIVEMIREHSIDVICNCEIFTTGFDCPRIDQIFLMRDTDSPVLYNQMIGRGLRGPKFGGTETCSVHLLGVRTPFMHDLSSNEFTAHIWGD